MKKFLKILATAGLAFSVASCGTTNDAYGNSNRTQYPNGYPAGKGVVYRTPDGNVYRQGEIYRDRNGNVYQNGRVLRTGEVYGQPGILGRNGTNTVYYPNTNANRLPPGQAKKIYGGSAKDYAPGQVKKRNRSYDNGNWKDDKEHKNHKSKDRYFDDKKDKDGKKLKNNSGKKAGMRD